MAKKEEKSKTKQLKRRDFLKLSGTSFALLLAGVPKGWVGGAYAAEGPETAKIRFGIIALTDCSSIVMAHELGLFKVRHRIDYFERGFPATATSRLSHIDSCRYTAVGKEPLWDCANNR